MLGVAVSAQEMENIFDVLDEDGSGYIAYDRLKEFMKMGKIPHEIIAKVKLNGKVKRKSIMFGAPPLTKSLKAKTPPLSSQYKQDEKEKEKENDQAAANNSSSPTTINKQRYKMIERALIVIKKATGKKISRKETVGFLKEKGMLASDIEVAYIKAYEQVFSTEERITYLSDLANARLDEVNEQKKLNDFLSQQINVHANEVQVLRDLLKTATDKLPAETSNETLSKLAANELTSKIELATKNVTDAEEQQDEQALAIHKRDLISLQKISDCVTSKSHFHGLLYFHQLDSVMRDSMPNLQAFLQKFDCE